MKNSVKTLKISFKIYLNNPVLLLHQATPDACAIFCQNLAKKIPLQDFGRKMDILQDMPEKWTSCKNCKNVSSYLPVFGYVFCV